MEPEKLVPWKKEIPNLENHHFSGSMLNFGGVDTKKWRDFERELYTESKSSS